MSRVFVVLCCVAVARGKVFFNDVTLKITPPVAPGSHVMQPGNHVMRPGNHETGPGDFDLSLSLPDLKYGHHGFYGYNLTSGGFNQCNCMPQMYCMSPPNGAGNIDIRIVTTAPSGITCGSGMVYCCHNQSHFTTTTTTTTTTSSPVSHTCGIRQRININDVTPTYGQSHFGDFPWTALVLGVGNDYVGGGVLINDQYVLTAAHKVASYSNGFGLKVRLGEWHAGNDSVEPYAYQEYSVARMAVHPQFDSSSLHNDVAVLKLTSSVPLSSCPHIQPVCLMTSSHNLVGCRCWVSGWGKDAFGPAGSYQEIQKAVDVVVMEQGACEASLRGTRLGSYFQLDRQSFVCAGGEPSKDACTGDGGSPLVCEVNGVNYLAGLVAWGIGCANYGVPGVYVNVQAYSSWISSQIY